MLQQTGMLASAEQQRAGRDVAAHGDAKMGAATARDGGGSQSAAARTHGGGQVATLPGGARPVDLGPSGSLARLLARAVQQRAGVDRPPAVALLQRVVHGLATPARTNAYVDDAHRFWVDPANAAKPLRALSDALFASVNAALPFACGLDYRTLGENGQFNPHAWQIWVDVDTFSKRAGVVTVGDLTQDEVANVASTLYHEARHAEQNFLIVRRRAGLGQSAAEIADDLEIPLTVAAAAASSPLQGGTADDDAKLADADAWERFLYEKYLPYERAMQRIQNAANGVKKAAKENSTLELYADLARAAAYQAYRAYAHELDAFAVGDEAGRAFRRRLAPTGAAKTTADSAATADAAATAGPTTPRAKADRKKQAEQIALVKASLLELERARATLEQSPQKDQLDRDVLDRAAAVAMDCERLFAVFEGRPMPTANVPDVSPEADDDDGEPPLVAITEAMASIIDAIRAYDPGQQTPAQLLADMAPDLSTAGMEYGALEGLPAATMEAITAAYDDVEDRFAELEADQAAVIAGGEHSPLGKAVEALYLACFYAEGM